MRVFKFGGGSVQEADSFRQLAYIVARALSQGEALVVVVSALGKTTRDLEHVLDLCLHGRDYREALEMVAQSHSRIIDQLFQAGMRVLAHQTIAAWQRRIMERLDGFLVEPCGATDRLYSAVVAEGEWLSSKLIDYYLKDQELDSVWLDARTCIKTQEMFKDAPVDWEATQESVKRVFEGQLACERVMVTQGFIGTDILGQVTTLGKEGSDFTGAILASLLSAEALVVWKDVPGIMNVDPKIIKHITPVKLDRVSYGLAASMARYGAKVLHAKAVEPLEVHHVPLYIKDFMHPEREGTEVNAWPSAEGPPIYIIKGHQSLLRWCNIPCTAQVDQLVEGLIDELTIRGTGDHLLVQSSDGLFLCVDHNTAYQLLIAGWGKAYKFQYKRNVRLLTILHNREGCGGDGCPFLEEEVLLRQCDGGMCRMVLREERR